MDGSERLRLFCALRLPDDALDARRRAGSEPATSPRGARIVPPANLHVTLAFLGSRPADELAAIAAALRAAAAGSGTTCGFALRGYRETRSVGMLTFDDEGGRAAALAERLQRAARGARRLPPRGAAVAAARHGAPVPRARRASSRRFRSSASVVPSDAAVYMFRLRPGGAQYEVLEVDATLEAH